MEDDLWKKFPVQLTAHYVVVFTMCVADYKLLVLDFMNLLCVACFQGGGAFMPTKLLFEHEIGNGKLAGLVAIKPEGKSILASFLFILCQIY